MKAALGRSLWTNGSQVILPKCRWAGRESSSVITQILGWLINQSHLEKKIQDPTSAMHQLGQGCLRQISATLPGLPTISLAAQLLARTVAEGQIGAADQRKLYLLHLFLNTLYI